MLEDRRTTTTSKRTDNSNPCYHYSTSHDYVVIRCLYGVLILVIAASSLCKVFVDGKGASSQFSLNIPTVTYKALIPLLLRLRLNTDAYYPLLLRLPRLLHKTINADISSIIDHVTLQKEIK